MSRQKLILAALLLVLALSIGYSVYNMPRQKQVGVAGQSKTTAMPTESQMKGLPAPVRLRFDLLERKEQKLTMPQRNLFSSSSPRTTSTVKKPVAPPLPPPPPPPPVEIVPEPEIPVETQVQLGRFTFLGYLEKDRVKTIFLSSEGEIFVVKRGDRFGNRKQFLVTDLTPAQLSVRQGDDPRTILVPLVEQTPLSPSGVSPRQPAAASGDGGTATRPATRQMPAWRSGLRAPSPSPAMGESLETEPQTSGTESEKLPTEGNAHENAE